MAILIYHRIIYNNLIKKAGEVIKCAAIILAAVIFVFDYDCPSTIFMVVVFDQKGKFIEFKTLTYEMRLNVHYKLIIVNGESIIWLVSVVLPSDRPVF